MPAIIHRFWQPGGQTYLLDKGCTILGSFQELPNVEIGTFYIEKEAMILSFTDGLTDLKNAQGRLPQRRDFV